MFMLFCRDVVNQLKQRRVYDYCLKTKWIGASHKDYACLQCRRITSHLTPDGVRLKRVGKFVDKNAEERAIRALYFHAVADV